MIFRVGYRWISQLIALLVYAVLLMPGFIKGMRQVIYVLVIFKYRGYIFFASFLGIFSPTFS